MMKPNREKVVAVLAFLILLLYGVFSIVENVIGPGRTYRQIPTNLNEATSELLQIDPRLHTRALGGRRNPFGASTDWEDVDPAPLAPPPLASAMRPVVRFGFLADRARGRPIEYRETLPVAKDGDDGQSEASDDAGESAESSTDTAPGGGS